MKLWKFQIQQHTNNITFQDLAHVSCIFYSQDTQLKTSWWTNLSIYLCEHTHTPIYVHICIKTFVYIWYCIYLVSVYYIEYQWNMIFLAGLNIYQWASTAALTGNNLFRFLLFSVPEPTIYNRISTTFLFSFSNILISVHGVCQE